MAPAGNELDSLALVSYTITCFASFCCLNKKLKPFMFKKKKKSANLRMRPRSLVLSDRFPAFPGGWEQLRRPRVISSSSASRPGAPEGALALQEALVLVGVRGFG